MCRNKRYERLVQTESDVISLVDLQCEMKLVSHRDGRRDES